MLGKCPHITSAKVTGMLEVKLGQEFVPTTRFLKELDIFEHSNSLPPLSSLLFHT